MAVDLEALHGQHLLKVVTADDRLIWDMKQKHESKLGPCMYIGEAPLDAARPHKIYECEFVDLTWKIVPIAQLTAETQAATLLHTKRVDSEQFATVLVGPKGCKRFQVVFIPKPSLINKDVMERLFDPYAHARAATPVNAVLCCDDCSRPLSTTERVERCSRCRKHYYCNRECQKHAWIQSHRNSCKQQQTK